MFRSMLIAGVVGLAIAGSASAQDVVLLGGKGDEDTMRLDGKGDADVTEARYGYGGYRGGYGGYRGGYYGGYRGGYGYGGYRGYYGGYGRGYGYGYGGYYRPYVGIGIGYGYGSYYGGGYYSPSYYSSPYYGGGCTCSAATIDDGTALTTARLSVPRIPGDSTFPYDGGPRDGFLVSVPQPAGVAQPKGGLLVSIPAVESGYRFPAFGEQPSQPRPTPSAPATIRVSYPAYGESMPSGFSGGSTNYRVSLR